MIAQEKEVPGRPPINKKIRLRILTNGTWSKTYGSLGKSWCIQNDSLS